MMDEYNYGPLEHEMAGGTHAEGWCDDCHGYTHMPWCPSYEQPSHEQPASARVEESDEWRVLETGSRTKIIDSNGNTVALGTGRNAKQRQEHAAQIASNHNQHQHCAAQLQYLGNRAEELSSLLAGMTTERDRLREAVLQVRGRHGHKAKAANFGDCGCDDCATLVAALNHAEQGEGS